VNQQFRYKEERIYTGNNLFIIGEMSEVPPRAPDDADGEDREDDAGTDLDDAASPHSAEDELETLFDQVAEEDDEKWLAEGRKRTTRLV